MGQSIPIGPWPDFETAEAFGGNALRKAAQYRGATLTEWAVLPRPDGLWKAEGYCHRAGQPLVSEGEYLAAGAD